MKRIKLILAVGTIACIHMAFAALCASEAETKDVVIATNEVVNYHLQKNQPAVTFMLTNNAADPYLWIMARARDKRVIEHGPGVLKIEVNGVEIGPDRSVLQDGTFRNPLRRKVAERKTENKKYNTERKGWYFKYDLDFVMNNQSGDAYATTNLNHWYAFDMKGIATNGANSVKLTELVEDGGWKAQYYGGFTVGSLAFGPLEDMKRRVADYEQHRGLPPADKNFNKEQFVRENYHLEIPKGLAQGFEVKKGFICRNGKPFFMAYANSFAAGRESVLKIYNYYGLINTRMSGVGVSSDGSTREIFILPIWLKDGWDKYRPQPWEIGTILNETWLNYDQGILTMLYCSASFELRSGYLDKFPELAAQTADGSKGKRPGSENLFPDFTSPLFQEYLRQSHTVLGREFKNHPGVWGASLWEEMGWRMSQGNKTLIPQGPEDLKRYRQWLAKKYEIIGRLNKEWESDFKNFEDIKFPEWKEQTANFANFQLWRSEATVKCAEIMYKAFKSAAPDQIVLGQKTYGDIGASSGYWTHDIDNWALTEWTDVSREYSSQSAMAHLGRASCLAYGGKVMEANNCFANCEFRQWDKTNKWHNLLDLQGNAAHPHIIQQIFNGNKALHWEMYDLSYLGDFHFIHYNKIWKESGKAWNGKKIGYDSPGTADVVIEERTLKIARAQQWIIRNASLVLPASVPKSEVAVLITTASRMIGHDPQGKLAGTKKIIASWVDNAGQDFYILGNLFDNMHLTFDCVEERIIDEIFKYKVLIVGYQANVMSRKTAEKIKEYVKKGGTVLFYPEAGTWDSVNFQKDKAVNEISPGFGLSELVAAKIENDKIIEQKGIVIKKDVSEYKAGETVMTNRYYGVKLESAGGEIMATAEDGQPVLVKSADGKAWYFGGYLGLTYYQSYPQHEKFAQLIEGILKSAGVERRVEIEGMADRRKVIPGFLEGEGYWLVGVNNFDDQAQKLKIKVNKIPDGDYEIVDMSGEGFTFEKSKDGNCHMKPDPEGARVKYMTKKISGKDLAKNGVTGDVEKYMTKVWLVRPAGVEAWVNATKEALRSYMELKKPLKVIIGAGAGDEIKGLSAELSKILESKGMKVEIVSDDAIKRKTMEGALVEDGYELEKYSHKVIDDEANLIVIGNASENSVVKHLETAGNYVFSKVPEIVSEKYPGKGRGVIQLVESINHVSYDATDKGRDAILAGGSDQEGTIKAIKELLRIMR